MTDKQRVSGHGCQCGSKEAALGRERAMLATWSREAQVLREASLLLNGDPRDLRALPLQWYQGPVVVLSGFFPTGMMSYLDDNIVPGLAAPVRATLQVGEHGVLTTGLLATRLS